MDAIIHFAIGLAAGLGVLLFLDFSARTEFGVVFMSGLWGLVPDAHWVFSELGVVGAAARWKGFHGSGLADLFWLHRFLDRHETERPKLEMAVALGVLFVLVGVYYWRNEWD